MRDRNNVGFDNPVAGGEVGAARNPRRAVQVVAALVPILVCEGLADVAIREYPPAAINEKARPCSSISEARRIAVVRIGQDDVAVGGASNAEPFTRGVAIPPLQLDQADALREPIRYGGPKPAILLNLPPLTRRCQLALRQRLAHGLGLRSQFGGFCLPRLRLCRHILEPPLQFSAGPAFAGELPTEGHELGLECCL